MELHLTPDIEARLNQLANETGREKDEFVRDALAGYFDELARVRETLDTRYDDIKSGKVKLIAGDEVIARLREKSAARGRPSPFLHEKSHEPVWTNSVCCTVKRPGNLDRSAPGLIIVLAGFDD